MEDATLRWFGGMGMAGLLLVLSYLFSLDDGSGIVPVLLLVAGLGMTVLLAVVGLTGIGPFADRGTDEVPR